MWDFPWQYNSNQHRCFPACFTSAWAFIITEHFLINNSVLLINYKPYMIHWGHKAYICSCSLWVIRGHKIYSVKIEWIQAWMCFRRSRQVVEYKRASWECCILILMIVNIYKECTPISWDHCIFSSHRYHKDWKERCHQIYMWPSTRKLDTHPDRL